MNNFVSQKQYQIALNQVNIFEERQEKIEKFKKELTFRLANDFNKFTFRIKGNQTIFAAYFIDENNKEQLVVGISKCSEDDVYDKMLGKLIAVRKALGLKINDIVDVVEPKVKSNRYKIYTYTIPPTYS